MGKAMACVREGRRRLGLAGVAAALCMGWIGCSSDHSTETPQGAGSIRLNEVQFITSGGPEWVELINPETGCVDIRGFEVANSTGDVYVIPEKLPMVPPGAFVMVVFDGLGPDQNDYDFSDNAAFLHTAKPLSGNVFADDGDACTLYSGPSRDDAAVVDMVAWGDYGHGGRYVNNSQEYGSSGPVTADQSIGVPPDVWTVPLETTWVIYSESETTPGSPNPIPAPVPVVPEPGAGMRTDLPSFAWNDWNINISAYRLEVDEDGDFSSPVVSVETPSPLYHTETPLPDGQYYWRVKSISATLVESGWSQRSPFTIETQENVRSALRASRDLGLHPPVAQRKDTPMLCLGCEESEKHPWNNPHIDTPEGFHKCPHCKAYCARASVAMINRYYQGSLTQDEISYHIFKQHGPVGKVIEGKRVNDLGHNKGFDEDQVTDALKYALEGQNALVPEDISFPKIVAYINENRPLVTATPTHVLVLDGYDDYEDDAEDTIHVINPWTGTEYPVKFSQTSQKKIWAPFRNKDDQGRKGDPLIRDADYNWTDTDKDGILDFDEIHRFNSKPDVHAPLDSDFDFISDFNEIWGFRFGKGLVPRYPDRGWDIWNKLNYDGDSLPDGLEDLNKNGTMDPGECDPYIYEAEVILSLEVAGADVNEPSVTINGVPVAHIYTGSKAGYQPYEVSFMWAGILKPGATNTISFSAYYGDLTGYDDFQIRKIAIYEKDDQIPGYTPYIARWIPGPYHLGDDTIAAIGQAFKDGKWKDPNPPGFWEELFGKRATFEFYWKVYGSE